MTDFFADVWPSYKMTGRWGEGCNHHLTLVSPYALLFVGTNFSLKCMRTIVLQLIFISCKFKSIVTIFFTVIDIRIIIQIGCKSQCQDLFIQILPNSDLKASMHVENFTHYSSATDKKCKYIVQVLSAMRTSTILIRTCLEKKAL